MQEMRVQSLGWEELPEKEMYTHTHTHTHTHIHRRGKWQPTPAFFPGEFHGQRDTAGYSPWGPKRVRHNLETKQQQLQILQVSDKRKLKMPQKQ